MSAKKSSFFRVSAKTDDFFHGVELSDLVDPARSPQEKKHPLYKAKKGPSNQNKGSKVA